MPANLDPRIGTDAYSQRLHSLIFSSLLQRDEQMNLQPDLAERWVSPDPLTYVFHLRHGVRFHNGQELRAADVKYTFDSILSGAVKTVKRGAFRMVNSVEAPDNSTVVFHLTEPDASFLWNLTRPSVGIVPRPGTPAGAVPPGEHPIGSGPFRFVRAVQDEEVVLERNPDYFGTPPSIERVQFRVVPDTITRALELRKGTADIALNSLTPDMVPALAAAQGIVVTEQPGTTLAYLAFNLDDPVLARREVRQALAYATDRKTIVQYLLRGQARLADSLLPPNHWAYNGNLAHYDYDPARASQLLDTAGYPRGANGVRLRLTLKTSTEESVRLLGAALQDQWRLAGVALELRPLEFATFYADISAGSFQIYTLRWIGANNDPDIFQYVFHSRKVPPAGANRSHYRNPPLDALLDRAQVEPDRDRRQQIYAEVQRIVADDLPYLNLWYLDNVCLHRARVTNVHIAPAGDYDFLDEIVLK
jgi:peptide/nickel transport system substrate-binding protein